MSWSFVGAVPEIGQGGGAFSWPKPAGVIDGDLLIAAIFASGVGTSLAGLDTLGGGFTVGPKLDQGSTPQIHLTSGAKIAASEGASWPATEFGTEFLLGIVLAYRHVGGSASIANLNAYRGTTTILRDTVSPLALDCGAYTPGGATPDNLGIYLVGAARNTSGGNPTITAPGAVTVDATQDYPDFGAEMIIGHEVQAVTFPARSFAAAFAGASCGGVAGRLADLELLPGASGFGFGSSPYMGELGGDIQ